MWLRITLFVCASIAFAREELAEELPSNKPCYCVVSYQLVSPDPSSLHVSSLLRDLSQTHKDGRTSNPLFLIGAWTHHLATLRRHELISERDS